jgi:hypothetical protein
VAKALGFECHEPAALLLIQASEQQIDVLVNDTIRMRLTIPGGGMIASGEVVGIRRP